MSDALSPLLTRRSLLRALACAVAGAALAPGLAHAQPQRPAQPRPNVIVMMVDDMGYSDIGCFGGEIPTPHLDALAKDGVRVTNFHNTARCCPSRASILTGMHPQQAGMGYMDKGVPGLPGYAGALSKPHVTIASVLQSAGYATAISGKWHLNPGDPTQEGFDRREFYERRGSRSFFPEKPEKGPMNESFAYLTDWFGDGVCKYIDDAAGTKPFFIYWTPTAPHYPLHAKTSDIRRHKGRYDAGPKAIADARYKRQVEMGIVDASWPYEPPEEIVNPDLAYRTDVRTDEDAYPPGPEVKLANAKSKQLQSSRRAGSFEEMMEVYAAMVDCMDQNVGKVVAKLKATGQYENTLFIFCSDNGTSDESQAAGKSWGQVSNTPFRRWKKSTYGGGNRTPLILSWPAKVAPEARGSINRTYGHLIDVLPTVLAATGAVAPAQDAKGRPMPTLDGRSLLPALDGRRVPMPQPLCVEHRGNLAVITEDWKIVSETAGRGGHEPWRLYDMRADPLERHDLAAQHPDIVKTMAQQWQQWADRVDARANSNDADDSKARINVDAMTP